MRDLKKRLKIRPASLPDWIHVDSTSALHITNALDFWLGLIGTKDVAGILRFHKIQSGGSALEAMNDPSISADFRHRLRENTESRRRTVVDSVHGLTEEQMKAIGLIENGENLQDAQKFLPQRRKALVDLWFKQLLDGNFNSQMEGEQEWYESVKAFIPPAELWGRHPGFLRFRDVKPGRVKLAQKEKKLVSDILAV